MSVSTALFGSISLTLLSVAVKDWANLADQKGPSRRKWMAIEHVVT
jgi:hypothetical protein